MKKVIYLLFAMTLFVTSCTTETVDEEIEIQSPDAEEWEDPDGRGNL